MWQPLWVPMTIASYGQSGKCQCVVPFWSRLATRCSCHTGPCRGSESSVSMCNCQNGHNWQLPVWGQSGQNLLCIIVLCARTVGNMCESFISPVHSIYSAFQIIGCLLTVPWLVTQWYQPDDMAHYLILRSKSIAAVSISTTSI